MHPKYNEITLIPLTFMMDPTTNLMNKPHYKYKRKKHHSSYSEYLKTPKNYFVETRDTWGHTKPINFIKNTCGVHLHSKRSKRSALFWVPHTIHGPISLEKRKYNFKTESHEHYS